MMLNKQLHDEKELLLQLSHGSERAYNKIYQLYGERLYGKLLRLLKSKLHASEIQQETFIKIWEQRYLIDPEKSFRSYLFRIAENKAYDFFRKTVSDNNLRRHLSKWSSEAYSHITECMETKENIALLNKAINSLPKQCREIFRHCKLNGKSYKEVSEMLGIATSTISNQLVKASHHIRNMYLSE